VKAEKPVRFRLSARQRWIFRAMALLMPVLLLAGVELFLRMAGYGYPTSFFLKKSVNGREMLTDNWQFGWRFFPKEIARTPYPVMFPLHKDPGTIRIFVFGESAAMGDPEPAFGFPRMLQAMLELSFPSNRFEVINVAMTAINSHVIREIAKDCASLEGDLWLVYMGNNEVVGPFGGGTVFSRQAPSLAFIHASLWLKQFRVVQWIGSLSKPRDAKWAGMEMFLRQQVSRADPRMAKVHDYFRRNLTDIVETGIEAGAKVIVGTVSVNLRDCPPFAAVHANSLSESNIVKWDNAMAYAFDLSRAGNCAEARHGFEVAKRAGGEGDNHAGWMFQMARCELALGSNDSARTLFNSAKEFDTLRFRADDGINAAIKVVTAPVRLVDSEQLLAKQSSNSIPGAELFYEHVHLTFEGNYLLARAYFDEVVRSLPTLPQNARPPSLAQCGQRLAWTDWDRLQVYEEVQKRLRQPPFTLQFGHEDRDREWQAGIDKLRADLTPERLSQLAPACRELLRQSADDWVLRENFAGLLEAAGDIPGAIEQWNEVSRLLPHDVQSQYHLGNLLDTLGRSDEAIVHFYAALRRDPNSPETRNGLALALANSGKVDAAQREFETLVRLKPQFTEARVNFGQFLARQGKVEAAIAQYELALKTDTNSAAAHVNLGRLMNQRGDKTSAIAHYEAALRINPRNAVAHFNFGNLLSATNAAEAARHYEEAVRAKPDFAEAHAALGMELARTKQPVEAEKHFVEALRLQPEATEAHFNYGVMLANQKRFPEAARQFSRTLELNPAHPKAREFLARVQGR
jgi:tetratricopeptide (TPR) repeat protein